MAEKNSNPAPSCTIARCCWISALIQLTLRLGLRIGHYVAYRWDKFQSRSYGKYWTMQDRVPTLHKRPTHVCVATAMTPSDSRDLAALVVHLIQLQIHRVSVVMDGVSAEQLAEVNPLLQEWMAINLFRVTTANILFTQPGYVRDESVLTIDIRDDLTRPECSANAVIDLVTKDGAEKAHSENPKVLSQALASSADCILFCGERPSLLDQVPSLTDGGVELSLPSLKRVTPARVYRAMKAYSNRASKKE
ncbi:hypothetical protein J8273_1442 [Carpediemonas membranifera]|uniref:Uncharacterized protein n=1 Tax=Carpediemonas membranifera TaxID=201153 RepID=A0A8J6BFM5_9EUKA|nr:hypothetical protein J8273_1442 [Carpediemonas membranifera]|eukprot:KAG9396462.1 hypothetical protein J8273_1442 [Carpediemonas membranifera]